MAERGGGRPVTVSDVQQLVKRKDEVEAQIKACYELLESVSAAGRGGGGRRGAGPARIAGPRPHGPLLPP